MVSRIAFMVLVASAAVVPAQTPVQLPTGNYVIDPAQSKVDARVAYFGVSHMNVTFPTVSGSLAYDVQTPQAIKLDVKVDATSLNAGSAWNNERLTGKDFFNTAVYKEIVFHGSKCTITGTNTANVDGDLIVRGISKPTRLAVTINTPFADIARTGRASLTAKTKIKRSQFGMTAYAMVVGEDVSLNITVGLVRR